MSMPWPGELVELERAIHADGQVPGAVAASTLICADAGRFWGV